MKNFTLNVLLNNRLKVIAMAILMFSFSSCRNANSTANSADIKTDTITESITEKTVLNSVTANKLEKAKKDGQTIFLVVIGKNAKNVEKAIQIATNAKNKVLNSEVINLDMDDATNSSLITKLGIADVTVPFTLVISQKGIAATGYPFNEATSELLVKAVPSPKQDEVLFAISEEKPVFIVVSKKGLTDNTTILKNCNAVAAKIASKPVVVEFDFNDKKESAFLEQIGINTITNKTKTVVINTAGHITDTFEGVKPENVLIASANKVIKSSCCPESSDKSGCK